MPSPDSLSPTEVNRQATGTVSELRQAALRESVADAAGGLYRRLLTDDAAAETVLPAKRLEARERKIGYSFPREHAWLLRAALIHKSFNKPEAPGGKYTGKYGAADVLAWHGDACLYAVLTESLIAAYPNASLTDLAAARLFRIMGKTLAGHAKALKMEGLVLVGKPPPPKIKPETTRGEGFEAVLGAVAASGGIEAFRASYFKIAPLPVRLRDLLAESSVAAGAGGGGGGGGRGGVKMEE